MSILARLVRRNSGRAAELAEFRMTGCRGPALPYLLQEALPVRLQRADKLLVAGFFVPRGPQYHLSQYRTQVNALGGKRINQLTSIGRIGFRGNDSMSFQSTQAVGQHVGGDALVGSQKFLERTESA